MMGNEREDCHKTIIVRLFLHQRQSLEVSSILAGIFGGKN